MRASTRAAIGLAAALGLVVGGATAAQAVPRIPVTPGQEVADVESDAHGFFTYRITGDEFCWTLDVSGLSTDAVMAHVHVGARNANGPIVIPLTVEPSTTFETEGCATPAEDDLAALAANPRGYYVNVHTALYPGGEIRGQLKKMKQPKERGQGNGQGQGQGLGQGQGQGHGHGDHPKK
jgi:hypothetical protein